MTKKGIVGRTSYIFHLFLGFMGKKLLSHVGVTRAVHLTPKARKLYKIASDLKRVTRKLNFDHVENKKRVKEALKYSTSLEFLETRLNKQSLNFLSCQLRMETKNARGRRYSFEDKVFALSLLKQSTRAYKILQKTFALPSRKCLISLLNKIPFNVGINPPIMETLKKSTDKLKFLDKHCILMFDEISLEPSLAYDKKSDVIGFEDCGGIKNCSSCPCAHD